MRMRYKTHGWLCSLIFCCAGLGMAQTSSASDSAQSQSVESLVYASVNASANAGVSESEVSGSGSRSGRSVSRSAPSTAGVSELSALQSAGRVSASALINALEGRSKAELQAGHGSRNSHPANRRAIAARNSGEPVKHLSGVGAAASYSEGFADSTKGTALISPPDSGTSSPLDWTPGLNFEFPDFDETQFLNPSLGGGASRRGEVKKAGRKAPGTPALSSAIDEQFGQTPSIDRDILGEGPSSSSIDQFGLQ